jgi:hypothetical protein
VAEGRHTVEPSIVKKPLRPKGESGAKPGPAQSSARKRTPAVHPLAAALKVFDQAAARLGLDVPARLKILNLGRSKYFELRTRDDPDLDVDRRDRLGYFLAIYELSGRLVGSAEDWLKAPNHAPLFAGRPPLERILGGRMEDLLATLAYLKSAYGGWA